MGPLKMRQPVQETGSLQDLPNPNRIEADKRLKWRANSSNVLILIVIISSAIGGRQIDCHQLPVEVGPQRLDQAQPQLAQNLFSYSYLGDNQSGNGQAAGSLRDSDEEDTREEIRDGGEVDFKLMNAAQDKLLAMKSLLNSTRQQQLIASSPEDPNHGRLATVNASLQCAHKGRHFDDGQTVPIEEQPCLNCTCRMAILQCYLRVCPPIISLEAHKRKLLASGRSLPTDGQECRMVREANQCCPVMKCGEELIGTQHHSQQRQPQEAAHQRGSPVASDDTHERSMQRASDNTGELQQAASLVQTTTVLPYENLPKLTVINGPAGQRDSILLITSNPQSLGAASSQQQPKKTSGSNSTSISSLEHDPQQQLVSSAPIIEALLETIYSSATKQLSGLNLQGACMVNGSLYFEGSAVLPEAGSSQCQYCYCIRQKVMCVKPRCHLIISGCTPKYNNEFACCPTSYTCKSSSNQFGGDASMSSLTRLTSASTSSGQLTAPDGLQARLSAALEAALSKMIAGGGSSQQPSVVASVPNNELDPNEPLTSRQIDGAALVERATQAINDKPSEGTDLVSKLSSMLNDGPASTISTIVTSTSTTTPEPKVTTAGSLTTSRQKEREHLGAEENTDGEEDNPTLGTEKEVDATNSKTTTPRPLASSTTSSTATARRTTQANAAEQTRASVSDFLEPMNKLGPHMNTPSVPSGCTENGRNYSIGEQIPTLESCKHCYCGPEGVKECKMVECNLKSGHNCRPITPEGHCCPIRFECPPVEENSAANAFKELAQCKSSTGLDNDCNTTPSGQTEANAPILKSTRLVDQQDDKLTSTGPTPNSQALLEPFEPDSMQQKSNKSTGSSANSLTEELDQFIMRIRPNRTVAGPLPDDAASAPLAELPAVEDSPSNETNFGSEGANNERDYDSVKSSAMMDSGSRSQSQSPSTLIPSGMVGIPSIEPETIENLAPNFNNNPELTTNPFDVPTTREPPANMTSSTGQGSLVEYANPHLNEPNIQNRQLDNVMGGQRDMRSTQLNTNFTLSDYLGSMMDSSSPALPESTNSSTGDTYEPDDTSANVNGPSMNYYLRNENLNQATQPMGLPQNASQVPHVRSLRDQHPALQVRPQHQGNAANSVDFDDDAILSLLNNQHQEQNFNWSQQSNKSGFNQPTVLTSTDHSLTEPVNGLDGAVVTPSPLPNQPTTGTPIGVASDRTVLPETTSWLRMLPDWTRSFGQRLNNGLDSFQGAADGQSMITLVAQNQSAPSSIVGQESPTGRSSRQNPFITMLKSIIATAAQQERQQSEHKLPPQAGSQSIEDSRRGANLIMRPLDIVAESAPANLTSSQQQQPRARSFGSPYEPSISPSELEIVTASAPLEPEVFGQTRAPQGVGTQELVVTATSSFARRSDALAETDESTSDDLSIGDHPPVMSGRRAAESTSPLEPAKSEQNQVVRYFSSLSSAAQQQPQQALRVWPTTGPPMAIVQQLQKLACYDQATNRTFQLNELIPKLNEPCKTCHCILGKEICQPLVCPERPGENCREERRPGECCSNYLCGDGLKPNMETEQRMVPMVSEPITTPQPVATVAPPQRPASAARNLSPNHHQINSNEHLALANLPKQSPPTQSQLPMMVRATDLAGILPPHLRFRSNSNVGQDQRQQSASNSNTLQFTQNQQQPTRHQPLTTNNNNDQKPQHRIGAQAQGDQQNMWTSFLLGSSLIRPPILMHPQRFIQQQNLNRRNDETGASAISLIGSNSLPFSTGTSNFVQNNRPDNQLLMNQINSMRFPMSNNNQRLLPPQQQQQTTQQFSTRQPDPMNTPDQVHKPSSSSINLATNIWNSPQPPNVMAQQMHSRQPVSMSQLPQPLRTIPLGNNLQAFNIGSSNSRPPSDVTNSMNSQPKPMIMASSPEPSPSADKVLFKQSQLSFSESSGFRPIAVPQPATIVPTKESTAKPQQRQQPALKAESQPINQVIFNQPLGESLKPVIPSEQSINTSPQPDTTTTTAAITTSTISKPMRFSQELPSLSELVPIDSPDIELDRHPHLSSKTEQSTSEQSTNVSPLKVEEQPTSEQSKPEEQVSSAPPTTTTQVDPSQTSTTMATTTSTSSRPPYVESSTTDASADEINNNAAQASTSSNDSFDFFRVSECDIYGRTYKVGQLIEELSSACRRCTCTSQGVDCHSKCGQGSR